MNGAVYKTDVTDMQFFEFLVGSFGLLRVVSNIDEGQTSPELNLALTGGSAIISAYLQAASLD